MRVYAPSLPVDKVPMTEQSPKEQAPKVGAEGKEVPDPSKSTYKSPGLRDVKTTGVFRVVNFELFVKPNRLVMGVGLVVLSSCVAYLAYLRAMRENNQQYTAMNDDGSFQTRRRASKWD